jgi:hypothetical protein
MRRRDNADSLAEKDLPHFGQESLCEVALGGSEWSLAKTQRLHVHWEHIAKTFARFAGRMAM